MGDPFAGQSFPRGPLIGAAVLIGSTLALVGYARYTQVGRVSLPAAAPVAAVELRFQDRVDGGVDVYTADQRRIGELAPGTNGFARGVLRSLVRERHREKIGPEVAFRLTRWTDGRLSLDDPATHQHVDLEVFGPTNAAVFARLLMAGAPPISFAANP